MQQIGTLVLAKKTRIFREVAPKSIGLARQENPLPEGHAVAVVGAPCQKRFGHKFHSAIPVVQDNGKEYILFEELADENKKHVREIFPTFHPMMTRS